MTPSPRLIEFLHGFEKCVLRVYNDGYGFPTVGWGHLVTPADGLRMGDTITQDRADSLFRDDLQSAVDIVKKHVKVPLSQGQFDGLVSFVFNVGHGRVNQNGKPGKAGFVVLPNGQPSTMLRMLNDGNYAGASGEFEKWTLSAGKRSRGLLRRRRAEMKMFLEG